MSETSSEELRNSMLATMQQTMLSIASTKSLPINGSGKSQFAKQMVAIDFGFESVTLPADNLVFTNREISFVEFLSAFERGARVWLVCGGVTIVCRALIDRGDTTLLCSVYEEDEPLIQKTTGLVGKPVFVNAYRSFEKVGDGHAVNQVYATGRIKMVTETPALTLVSVEPKNLNTLEPTYENAIMVLEQLAAEV